MHERKERERELKEAKALGRGRRLTESATQRALVTRRKTRRIRRRRRPKSVEKTRMKERRRRKEGRMCTIYGWDRGET